MSWAAPTPAGGWYPDPFEQGSLRWFDGHQWTHHLAKVDDRLPEIRLPFKLWWRAALVALALKVAEIGAAEAVDSAGAPLWLIVLASVAVLYGGLIVLCVVLVRRHFDVAPRRALGLHLRAIDLGWGALAWLGIIASNAVLVFVVFEGLGIPFESNVPTDGEGSSVNWPAVAMFAMAAVIAAPIVEEIFFRGLLQRSLRSKLPAWVAIAVQAAIFGLYHLGIGAVAGDIGLVIVLSFAGVIFGVVAERTRRLGPSMVAHCILNSIATTAFIVNIAT